MNYITESVVEAATLEWFESLGYTTIHGPNSERQTYADVVLIDRLRSALKTINPNKPSAKLRAPKPPACLKIIAASTNSLPMASL